MNKHPDVLTKRLAADVSEQCVIVCAILEDGVQPEDAFLVRDTLNSLDTDGWWFLNPGTFIVAIRSSRAPSERASACESALARIAREVPSLSQLGVGSTEGPVLCHIAEEGHLDTPPIGDAVNRAARLARENAS